MLTETQFSALFPQCPAAKAKVYLPLLVAAMTEFLINTRARICAFVAEIGEESEDFKYFQEIASGAAYEGREDLGNSEPGDGRNYKGRGPIQITGRTNYTAAGKALGLPLIDQPELLAQPENGFRAAGWFWQLHGLNEKADLLTLKRDAPDLVRFDRISRVINGGTNGRAERRARYKNAVNVVGVDGVQEPVMALDHAEAPAVPVDAAGDSPADAPVSTPVDAPADEPIVDQDLMNKISANPTAQEAGKNAMGRLGVRVGRSLALVYGALQAGNLHAWMMAVVLLALVGAGLYIERHEVRKGLVWIKHHLFL